MAPASITATGIPVGLWAMATGRINLRSMGQLGPIERRQLTWIIRGTEGMVDMSGVLKKWCRTGCGRRVWYFDTNECGECGQIVCEDGRKRGRRGGWDSDPAKDVS